MPEYTVTSPDGSEYEVTAPEGGTKEQAIQYVQGEVAAGRLKPKVKAKPPVSVPPLKTMGPLDQALQESRADASELTTKLRPNVDRATLESLNALDVPFRAAGNAVMEATGSPAAATAAYALPQFIGPASVVKIVERAVKLGKVSREAAPSFAEVLKKRLAKEGVTGLPKGKLDDLTPEQVDKIIEAMGKTPLGQPGKPIKSVQQKAGAKVKESVTPEDITGDPNAGNLDDVPAFNERPEPKLGAEPAIIDPAPEPKPAGTKPVKPMRDEGGKINPFVAVHIASTVTGAGTGAALDPDHPIQGGILGAIAGSAVGHGVTIRVTPRAFSAGTAKALNPAAQLNVNRNAEIEASIGAAEAVKWKLKTANIPENRFFAVAHAIETGDVSALLPQEIQVAQLFSQEVGRLGMAAQEAGVIQHLKKHYAPLMFDTSDRHTRETLKKLGYDLSKTDNRKGFSTFTPHQLEQTITDYDTARQLGLKPKTMKLDELFGHYANSVIRATENKKAVTELANLKTPDGAPLVGRRGERGVGRDWEPINKGDTQVPELNDMLVHPDIVDSVRTGFSSYDPNILARAAIHISMFTKRTQTAYSMFHPNSIMEAASAEMLRVNPLYPIEAAKSVGKIMGVPLGVAARGLEKAVGLAGVKDFKIPYQSVIDKALEKYRQSDPMVDLGLRGGLKVNSTLEDRAGYDAFQKAMKWVGDVPVVGRVLPTDTLAAIDKAHQQFTWDYVHTGAKIHNFSALFESEVRRDMLAAAKAGREPTPLAKIAEDAAAHVNSLAGGIDWYRIAEGVENKYGRQIALFASTPRGQSYMSMVGYAPDWMVSTLAPWLKTMGITGNEAMQRYAQNYIAKSLVMQVVIADGFNLKNTGHHLWENNFAPKDKSGNRRPRDTFDKVNDMTYVDRGDGTKQQMFKHLNEFLHLLTEPDKFVVNKTSNLLKAPYETLLNKQYPSVRWAPDISQPSDSRETAALKQITWPLRQMMPITGQQGISGGTASGVWGYLGRPVYGLTAEQREQMRRQRMEEKAKAMQNR